MRAFMQRVQARAERRLPALTRYRQPESLPIELHRKRIYIVPSAFGIGFSVLLLIMMIGALNYANNAALLLTCLLGAATAASMLMTFRNMHGLRLQHIQAGHAVAGEMLELTLTFESIRVHQAIRLDLGDAASAVAFDVDGSTRIKLNMPTSRRGWQALPRMRVWSSWPLGLFRAWSWLRPDPAMLVWPRPERDGPSPVGASDDAHRMRLHRGEELAALRDYRVGDPQRHIAWKASARHPNLQVKDFEQPQAQPQWQLDWRQVHGLDHEARIARLARWVDEAHAQRRTYSLWLPDNEIAGNSGPLHHAHCMNALAQLP